MLPFSLAISTFRTPFLKNKWMLLCVISFFALWISTLIGTSDFKNWILENALVFFFLIFLVISYKHYQFSDLSYLLIFVYLSLHVYGAKYTYAENPFGFWLQEALHTSRNHYDRIVHFSFGFLLAYPMREVFIIWKKFPNWVGWALPIEITLSVSGLYELVEWAVADLVFPEQGAAYLGTQGDIWDAQKDMFVATLGAVLATSVVSVVKNLPAFINLGQKNIHPPKEGPAL
jgi:putative membrane protein